METVPRDRFTPAELRQRLGVETPEHVEVHFDLAGVGSRAAAAIIDTVLIVLGLLPFLPGLLMVFLQRRNQRLGDLAAGTIVVRDHPTEWTLGAGQPAAAAEPIDAGTPERSDDEFRLLDQFLARQDHLNPRVQVRLATELARRFQDRVPRRTADADSYLAGLHAEEQRKRRSRFATRAQVGAAGRTTVTAERFVAKKRDGWEAFHALARRVERAGVGALPPRQIPAFAARYREVAADLARARTYGVDPRVIEYLERVVSAGHNALYRSRGRDRPPFSRYVMADFPAAVVVSWRYVLVAFLLFAAPAVVGYGVARTRPELAEELMPVMVSRAQQAADREARGQTYAQAYPETRPPVAAWSISNNIAVVC